MTDIFNPNKKRQSLKRSTIKSATNQDGELIEQEEINEFTAVSDSEPHFAKCYFQDRRKLKKLAKNYILVFIELSFYSGYNTNQVILNTLLKQQICDDLEICGSTLDNALTILVKHQFLARIGKGTYLLNPFYIGKGNWSENKKIRNNISYDIQHADENDENSPIIAITFNFDAIPNFIKKHAALAKNKPSKATKPKPAERKSAPAAKSSSKTNFFRKIFNLMKGKKKVKNSNAYIHIHKAKSKKPRVSAENTTSTLP